MPATPEPPVSDVETSWTEYPVTPRSWVERRDDWPSGTPIDKKVLARYHATYDDEWCRQLEESTAAVKSASVALNARLGLSTCVRFPEPPLPVEMLAGAGAASKGPASASSDTEDEERHPTIPSGPKPLGLLRRLEFYEETQPSVTLPLVALAFHRVDSDGPTQVERLLYEARQETMAVLTVSQVDLSKVRIGADGRGTVDPNWRMGKTWMWFTLQGMRGSGKGVVIACPTEGVRVQKDAEVDAVLNHPVGDEPVRRVELLGSFGGTPNIEHLGPKAEAWHKIEEAMSAGACRISYYYDPTPLARTIPVRRPTKPRPVFDFGPWGRPPPEHPPMYGPPFSSNNAGARRLGSPIRFR